jgi:serine/threonine-protein kinase
MPPTNSLGRFQIIRELARSNDIVYEAVDPSHGRRIALKELQVAANLTGQARIERIQRFTREARAAARLKHPNVVRILDHGQAQGRYYIAMEFLEGQSLRDVLRLRGALPLSEALRIAIGVANGLEFAHKHGVIHRDVKPDNVHLEPDGRVVITDFGIARLTFEPTLTAEGQVFGTPSYMSPEQVTGKGLDRRSDLFSLGVMLFEMVAGRKPFTGDSVITITYNIMNMALPPLGGSLQHVDAVIRCATSKDPSQRYGSAAEMLEDLRLLERGSAPLHALRKRPPSAAPPSTASLRTAPPAVPVTGAQRAGGALPVPLAQGRPLPPGRAGQSRPPTPPPAAQHHRPPTGPPPRNPVPGPAWGPPGAPAPAMGYPAQAAGPMVGYPAPAPVGPGGFHGSSAGAYPQSGAPYPVPGPTIPPAGGAGFRDRGTDYSWLFGWLALAVVLGLMVLGLVWLGVTSYDRFQADTAGRVVAQQLVSADDAFRARRYPEAMAAYVQAANSARGPERASALRSAAWSAAQVIQGRLGPGGVTPPAGLSELDKLARQAQQWDGDSPALYLAWGRVYGEAGQFDDASTAFDRSIELCRSLRSSQDRNLRVQVGETESVVLLWKAAALYHAGEVARGKQDREGARKWYVATIRAAPNTQYAKNAQVRLTQLQSGIGLLDPAASSGGTIPGWDNGYQSSGSR